MNENSLTLERGTVDSGNITPPADSFDALAPPCLIKQAAHDKSALKKLFIAYKNDVFAFALSIYNNRTIAEDCVQETFIRLPAVASKFQRGSSEKAFILGIARNTARELYRNEIRFHAGAAKMEQQTPLAAAPQSGVLEIARNLPKRLRVPLMLRIYSGMPFKEIARLLKIPESTAKSRVQRAVRIISTEFKAQNQK